jgi:gliding motility-associated-like protein
LVVESPKCPGEEGSLIIQDLNGIYDANTLRVEIEGFDTLMVNTLPFLLGGLTPGRYQLKIVDESTFSIDTNIQVEIPDLFTIAIENDPNEFTGTPIQLSLTTVGNLSSIEWAPAGVLSCTNCFDPVISQLTNDIWINASGVSPEGCIASDSILIRVKPNPASFFYIPNVFTPNDDGQNDLFGVQFIESANVQVRLLEVYDRWGQFIYSSGADGNRGWDGQFKGDPCPSGVYIYRYQIALPDGRLQEGSGDITLLR